MRRAIAVLALLLVAGGASAQDQPDVRERSGMPIMMDGIDAGVLSVKVVHGASEKIAAEGTPVHLVAMRADGTVEKVTKPLAQDGRALFAGLETNGSVIYYVYCLLGDDRLESQPIQPSSMAGAMMVLAARPQDDSGAPVGPPVDDHVARGQKLETPAGEVWVDLDGVPAPGTTVELMELGGSTTFQAKAEARGEDDQRARFTDVPGGPSRVWAARVKGAARTFWGRPFMISPAAGARRTVVVFDQLVLSPHFGGGLEDEDMRFDAEIIVRNFSGLPWDPGKAGLVIQLPRGAEAITVPEQLANRLKVDEDKGAVVWHGPLKPGPTEITLAFRLPVDDGRFTFDVTWPLRVLEGSVAVEYAPGASVTPPAGMTAQLRDIGGGRKFWVFAPLQIAEGEALRLSVEGLPKHPYSQKVAKIAAGLAVLALVGWALWVVVFAPGRRGEGGDTKDATARRRELTSRRDRLYDELVKLEKKHAGGGLESDKYTRERAQLIAKLTAVLRQLDAGDTYAAPGAKTA